jgi:hypothetical protein
MATNDRHGLESQLATAHADLKSAHVAHAKACLKLAQDPASGDAKLEVEKLEEEIQIHERTIARLEAAKLARTAGETEEAKAARRAAVRKAMKDVARLETEIRTVTEKIALQLESIAPLSAQLQAAIDERGRTVSSALRTGFGRAKDLPKNTELYTAFAAEQAIKSALIDSGLTHRLLADSITVRHPEHRTSLEQMREGSAKQLDYIADALNRSLAAVDRKGYVAW